MFLLLCVFLRDSDQAGWWPLLSGWQGEIETSVSSDFTAHVKPSLIAWLTDLAEGLASDRVPRAYLLWFLNRNLEAHDSESAGEQFPLQSGSPVGPAYLPAEVGLILGGGVGSARPGRGGEGGHHL